MSLKHFQNNCVRLSQYSSVQTPVGSKYIKEPQTSSSLWAGGTDYGVCLKIMSVYCYVSVTAITFSDGSRPPSLTSLSLSASIPPYRDRTPWAKGLPQNCLQPSLNPKIYQHLPSELHATVQAPADTQETPNTERHTVASGWNRACETNRSPRDFCRLPPFVSLWCFSELAKAWRTWGGEYECAFHSCWGSSTSFVCFILLFLEKLVKESMLRILVGTMYCQYVLFKNSTTLSNTCMLPTIIKRKKKKKSLFFPAAPSRDRPKSVQFCPRCKKTKHHHKTEVALALRLFRDYDQCTERSTNRHLVHCETEIQFK